MPSKQPHPALTVDGWTSSSIQVADQMLSDFFLSEYSQSFCFPEHVSSLPWLLQRYINDPTTLALEIQQILTTYFSKQFSDVQVEVTANAMENSISVSELSFFMTFTDDTGELFNLNRLLRYNNLKIVEITNILAG